MITAAKTEYVDSQLEDIPMAEMLFGLWIGFMLDKKLGSWGVLDNRKAFVLEEEGAVSFVLGAAADSDGKKLFLGHGNNVGSWFFDIKWKKALSRSLSLRLECDIGNDNFDLVIPCRPTMFNSLPANVTSIELSEIAIDNEGDIVRIRTRELPFRHEGGKKC